MTKMNLGVKIEYEKELGKDFTIKSLKVEYPVIIVADHNSLAMEYP
jgi:hypothetical protein